MPGKSARRWRINWPLSNTTSFTNIRLATEAEAEALTDDAELKRYLEKKK